MERLKKILSISVISLAFGSMLIRFFTDNFGLPYTFVTSFDAIAAILVIAIVVINYRNVLKNYKRYLLIGGYILLLLLSNIIAGFSFFNIAVGIRMYLRLLMAFVASVELFDKKNVYNITNILFWLFLVNSIFTLYQYTFMNLSQDRVGGIFGNTKGCNSVQNVFMCLNCIIYIVFYLNKKCSLKKLLTIIVLSIFIAAISELTVFFLELAVIAGCAIILNFKKKPKVMLCVAGMSFLILVLGITLYMVAFPERRFLLSISNIIEYLGGTNSSTGVYKISRLKPFSQISNLFFDSRIDYLFGLGTGNCSSVTRFYENYHPIYNYSWFSSAHVFMETGILGTMYLFILVITYILFNFINYLKEKDEEVNCFSQIGIILGVISIVLFIYNSSLHNAYTSFILGLAAAMPIILNENNKRCKEGKL